MIHLSEVVPVTDIATVALRIPARQSWPLMSMQTANYLNLDILFHRDGDHYTVRARNSVGSESSRAQSFMVPFTPQEREMLTGDMPDPGHLNVTPQQVGQRLYEALFQGEIRDLLVRSHEQAHTLAGLRLRLHLNDTAELALLPWEYLYDAKEARFLALTARLSIVRYLALGEPPQALQVDPPLRVLVVLANPADIFPQLDVEAEWQQLQTVLAPLVDQGIIELVRLPRPTRNALADHLEQYPVHVLHFVGHGNHDAASGEGGLYLVNEAGAADFVPASVLQVLLADTRDRRNALRLAFLNGCLTGRSAQVDPFAGTAQQLVQHGVPAVIAMQYSVTDGAATELAHRFYRALARSYPVDAALAQARKGIYIQGNYLEWGTPVLFLRAPDGQLFTVAGAEKLSPLLPDVECPYRGLEVFEAEHAPLYFGRENMIQRLLAKVAETNFIAVVGPSGSGKSSLVRAGLIPALAKGALTGSAQWAVATLRPGSDPVRSLISALLQLGDPQTDYASRIAEVRRLANMLMADDLPLADLLDPLHERHPGLVLVVDQFEESFTLCSDVQARDKFFEALLTAASQDRIKVIVTLRANYLGNVLQVQTLGQIISSGQINVLPMTQAEQRDAIEKPALAVGRSFESGLLERIHDDLKRTRGDLPVLQFTLQTLWEYQTADGLFTHAAYQDIGEVSGALARHASTVINGLTPDERARTQRLFRKLVRIDDEEQEIAKLLEHATNRRININDLDGNTQSLIQDRLVRSHLVVTGRNEATGEDAVELAHEALIRHWPLLGDWLIENLQDKRTHQSLSDAVHIWERYNRDRSLLYRGRRLHEALRWQRTHPDETDAREAEFLKKSKRLRLGMRVGAVGVTVAILVLLSTLLISRDQPAEKMPANHFNIAVAGFEVVPLHGMAQSQLAELQKEADGFAQNIADTLANNKESNIESILGKKVTVWGPKDFNIKLSDTANIERSMRDRNIDLLVYGKWLQYQGRLWKIQPYFSIANDQFQDRLPEIAKGKFGTAIDHLPGTADDEVRQTLEERVEVLNRLMRGMSYYSKFNVEGYESANAVFCADEENKFLNGQDILNLYCGHTYLMLAWSNRENTLLRKQLIEKGLDAFHNGLLLNPESTRLRVDMGNGLAHLGWPLNNECSNGDPDILQEAEQILLQAVDDETQLDTISSTTLLAAQISLGKIYFWLGRCYFLEQRLEYWSLSEAHFRQGLQLSASFSNDVQRYMAKACVFALNPLSTYQSIEKLFSNCSSIAYPSHFERRTIAQAYIGLGDLSLNLWAFDIDLDQWGNAFKYYNEGTKILIEIGDDEAIKNAEAVAYRSIPILLQGKCDWPESIAKDVDLFVIELFPEPERIRTKILSRVGCDYVLTK